LSRKISKKEKYFSNAMKTLELEYSQELSIYLMGIDLDKRWFLGVVSFQLYQVIRMLPRGKS
jgi:hypothetical protein